MASADLKLLELRDLIPIHCGALAIDPVQHDSSSGRHGGQRKCDGVRIPGAFDDDVRPDTLEALPQRGDGVGPADIEGHARAEREGEAGAFLRRHDRRHLGRASLDAR